MFCSCPSLVRNQVTGKLVRTACGRCHGCSLNKASIHRLRIEREFELLGRNRGFALFVTLTYDNDNVPAYVAVRDVEHFEKVVDIVDADTGVSLPVSNSILDELRFSEIPELTNYDILRTSERLGFDSTSCRAFGGLRKRDTQLYLKRVRRALAYSLESALNKGEISISEYSKKCSAFRFRYFIVGEYGGRLRRPHYHAILFFHNYKEYLNGQEKSYCDNFYQKVSQEVSKAWKFGRVHIDKVSNSNVSAYLSNYSASVEDFGDFRQTAKEFKQFYTFSRQPCIGSVYDELQAKSFFDRVRNSVFNGFDFVEKRFDAVRGEFCSDFVFKDLLQRWFNESSTFNSEVDGSLFYKVSYLVRCTDVRIKEMKDAIASLSPLSLVNLSPNIMPVFPQDCTVCHLYKSTGEVRKTTSFSYIEKKRAVNFFVFHHFILGGKFPFAYSYQLFRGLQTKYFNARYKLDWLNIIRDRSNYVSDVELYFKIEDSVSFVVPRATLATPSFLKRLYSENQELYIKTSKTKRVNNYVKTF